MTYDIASFNLGMILGAILAWVSAGLSFWWVAVYATAMRIVFGRT